MPIFKFPLLLATIFPCLFNNYSLLPEKREYKAGNEMAQDSQRALRYL